MENLNFSFDYQIPDLSEKKILEYCEKAKSSARKRIPLVMHKPGDDFNQVFNFVCKDSYMRPHLHPKKKMIEKMHLIKGSFRLFFFNDDSSISKFYDISSKGQKVQVPSNTWHTYIITSDISVIFETMVGKYDPLTWKKMADWAPDENHQDSNFYLKQLKDFKNN